MKVRTIVVNLAATLTAGADHDGLDFEGHPELSVRRARRWRKKGRRATTAG
jgi:hypothetical protein